MRVVAETFYRLEVHNRLYGVAIEEYATLSDVLDRLDVTLAAPPRVVSIDAGRVTLEGTTDAREHVRIVLSFYHRTSPPGEGWSGLAHLPR